MRALESDTGLSQCIVYDDPNQMVLETGAVACLLLWPLIRTAVLPSQYMPAAVPLFHRDVHTHSPPVRQVGHPPLRQISILNAPAFRQPPRVPQHAESGLPVPTERDRLGSEVGGGEGQVTNMARPGARSGSDETSTVFSPSTPPLLA